MLRKTTRSTVISPKITQKQDVLDNHLVVCPLISLKCKNHLCGKYQTEKRLYCLSEKGALSSE